MNEIVEFDFWEIEENLEFTKLGTSIIEKCFEVESISLKGLYLNIIFTTPEKIREINKEHRNIDKETDVLSFPILEKEEILNKKDNSELDMLGDIIISIQQVEKQAIEYGHSFERELAYMIVHGFYHLIGFDHMCEEDKKQMREKEENILEILNYIK